MADKTCTFLYVLFALSCILWDSEAASGPICFECKGLTDPDGCKNFHQCSDGQRCFKEVIQTEDNTAIHTWGCASTQLCQLESNLSSRRKRLGETRCFACCDDNFCNFGPCTNVPFFSSLGMGLVRPIGLLLVLLEVLLKDYCANVTCQNGATCRNTALFAVCDCVLGYSGDVCQTEIDECASSPCQNNGTCINHIGSYECTCPSGFTGDNCEVDIDECASNPCQFGGNCTDGPDMFDCDCVDGYFGEFCETDIDECASSPCKGNSTCQDLVNAYKCVCPAGITGINCDINIDDCQNVTCRHGGICNDYTNFFECKCKLGFIGTFCEISTGRVCYTCDDVSSVSDCAAQIVCEANEECYIEHELVSPGVFNFNMGCIPTAMCSYLENTKKRSTAPIQLCYECCDINECNHHACAESRGINTTMSP